MNYEKNGILCNPTLKLKIIPDLKKDGFFKQKLKRRIINFKKNKDIMDFARKWMKLENTILSEVAQYLKGDA